MGQSLRLTLVPKRLICESPRACGNHLVEAGILNGILVDCLPVETIWLKQACMVGEWHFATPDQIVALTFTVRIQIDWVG